MSGCCVVGGHVLGMMDGALSVLSERRYTHLQSFGEQSCLLRGDSILK